MFKSSRIYLDYASLTPIDPGVLKVMKKYFSKEYANASSLYKEGVAAKKAIQRARESIAQIIHAHPDEIYFTSGGTESNNLAILGAVEKAREEGRSYGDMHVIASAIEHSSVMEILKSLGKKGVSVDHIPVNEKGLIDLDELKKKIRPNTIIVSVMMVNNEIGTMQPVKEIERIIRHARNDSKDKKYPLFHTDAAQAPVVLDMNMEKLGADLLTLDSSKIYGPRGMGAIYMKRNAPISPIILGGGQERGIRPGTENLPGIMGMAKALELVHSSREKEGDRLRELKRYFLTGLRDSVPGLKINPESDGSVSPHILNVSFPGIDNELFVINLDAGGVACSTKSSCMRDEEESYVLRCIGADSRTSVRFSFGRWTKKGDLKRALKIIGEKLNLRFSGSSVSISATC